MNTITPDEIATRGEAIRLSAARDTFRRSVLQEAQGRPFSEAESIELAEAFEILQATDPSPAKTFEAEVRALKGAAGSARRLAEIHNKHLVSDEAGMLAAVANLKDRHEAAKAAAESARRELVESQYELRERSRLSVHLQEMQKRYPEFFAGQDTDSTEKATTKRRR